ncbi:MAG: alanine--tRNA ligase, partial [Rhodoferax sp.]|nr:alanine--tRNA ligase [Rhodoferax sp.]
MTTPAISVADIRRIFLDFFESKGHTAVASSPLVPGNDPTLMFTNSGMVQFKDVFLGTDRRSYVRAASVQACLRAGGKHNDLENVGYTARHHTFFEMLGNWSFGDYFKRESLHWGWELLTQVYRLPADKLWATVYIDDDEAYDIWTKEIGLPPERVVRIGDNKGAKYASDNFWMMADTGPCGPCSEIFYDHGPEVAGGPPGSPEQDGDRYIEIWNHVFMQFDMQPDGRLLPLPAPCVDTGMGLERLAAVLQHVHSNYEIDLLDGLVRAAARETGCTDPAHPSLRVIADHIRATAFLVSDGVVPSNEGRGYVQRRIVRRAIRHGYKLGCTAPFFHKLVPDLVAGMGQAYPRLAAQQQRITEVLKAEEERFFETLAHGMQILDEALAGDARVLPGDVAFKLHDTFGFPLDLSADVCRERGVVIDEAGFHAAMERQKAQGRAAGKFKMDKALDYSGDGNDFVGYEELTAATKIVAMYADGAPVGALKAGQTGVLVLETTPFYSESGGQVGDQGTVFCDQGLFQVADTQKLKADVFAHHGRLQSGQLAVGDAVTAHVDAALRAATMRNHSVTHLMH